MGASSRKMLPAYLLLAAAGVATGATITGLATQGSIAWDRLLSAVLLLMLAVGYARHSRGGSAAGTAEQHERRRMTSEPPEAR